MGNSVFGIIPAILQIEADSSILKKRSARNLDPAILSFGCW